MTSAASSMRFLELPNGRIDFFSHSGTGRHPRPRGKRIPVVVDPVLERSSDQSRVCTLLREARWHDHHPDREERPSGSLPRERGCPRSLRQKDRPLEAAQ